MISARLYLYSLLEAMCFAARELGCNAPTVSNVESAAINAFDSATDILNLNRAWSGSAAELVDEIEGLYPGRRKKLVDRACLMIRNDLQNVPAPHRISIKAVAASLGVSTRHFSRVFKRATGMTFERYVMMQRLEFAKRLLLNPVNNVCEVAQRCGFRDPSYFARVFRALTGCAPKEFRTDPLWSKRSRGALA